MMNQRTFQHRVSAMDLGCIVLISAVALWLFLQRAAHLAGVAFLVTCLDVAVIERVIHTTYTLTADGLLVVYRGRFSKKTILPLAEIIRMEQVRTWWRPAHYILIEYSLRREVSVKPDNEEAFIAEILKRQKRMEKNDK